MSRKPLIRLLIGFRKFREKYFLNEDSIYRKQLQNGQTPKTLIIGCCDSRVDPALISSASPGDLFVIRNVANLVPPFEDKGGLHGVSSAIEFAIVNLKVENVVILGHRQCGGIRALMTGFENPSPSFIKGWMSIASEARENVLARYGQESLDSQCSHCEMESIRISLRNLRSFPFVQQAIKDRNLNIVGTYFDLEEGKLWEYDENKNIFFQLEA